jgi:hypothetical protein
VITCSPSLSVVELDPLALSLLLSCFVVAGYFGRHPGCSPKGVVQAGGRNIWSLFGVYSSIDVVPLQASNSLDCILYSEEHSTNVLNCILKGSMFACSCGGYVKTFRASPKSGFSSIGPILSLLRLGFRSWSGPCTIRLVYLFRVHSLRHS